MMMLVLVSSLAFQITDSVMYDDDDVSLSFNLAFQITDAVYVLNYSVKKEQGVVAREIGKCNTNL